MYAWEAPTLFHKEEGWWIPTILWLPPIKAHHYEHNYTLRLKMQLADRLLDTKKFKGFDMCKIYGNLSSIRGIESPEFVFRTGKFEPLEISLRPTYTQIHFEYPIPNILLGWIQKKPAMYLQKMVVYTKNRVNRTTAVLELLEILGNHNLWLNTKICEYYKPICPRLQVTWHLGHSNFCFFVENYKCGW